jgi:hypothetical protein
MAVGFSNTNKPLNPRGQDASPKGYNRAKLFSGKALDFDGVNDLVTGTASVLPTGANPFTTCFYFNKDADGEAVFWGTRSTNQSNGVGLFSGNKVVHFFYGNDLNSSSNIESEKWYFVAVTFDGTTRSIYINGQFDISDTPTGVNVTGTDYKLGYGGAYYHNGRLANTKVFNVALTAAQVADLYNNPEKVVPTGVDNTALKLWLPMQEGAGTTAYDGSGNGNHGTISGATYVHGIGAPVSQTAVIDWNKNVNLLVNSENFGSTGWDKLNSLPSSEETGVTAPDGNGSVTTRFTFSSAGHIIRQYTSSSDTIMSIGVWVYIEDKGTGGTGLNIDWGDGTGQVFDVSTYDLNTWYLLEAENLTKGSFAFVDISANPSGTAPNGLQARFWGAHMNTGATLGAYIPNNGGTPITSPVLLPQGLTTGRDITGVNLFENVRKQGALNLDGNSWAEVHDNASLDMTPAMTMECWVDFNEIDSAALRHFIVKPSGATWATPYARYSLRASNAEVQWWFESAGYLETYSAALTGWNHIAVTKNGTAEILYVNGAQVDTATNNATITASAENLLLGQATTGTEPLDSQIAQPRIYNRALTAAEVLQNYNSGKNTYTNN